MNINDISSSFDGPGYSISIIDKFNINENMLKNRIFKEKMDSSINSSSFTIFKNQYLFASFENIIIIIDIQKEIVIKRFFLLCSFQKNIQIYYFKYLEDNHLLLKEGGNLYLFEYDIIKNNINIVGYLDLTRYKGYWILSELKTTNELVISTDKCTHFLCDNFYK